MPVTFIFTSFVPSKLKVSTLNYRSLIHIGIVDMDGQLHHQSYNKHRHRGGAICCYNGMAVANQSPLPLGASLEGVG